MNAMFSLSANKPKQHYNSFP